MFQRTFGNYMVPVAIAVVVACDFNPLINCERTSTMDAVCSVAALSLSRSMNEPNMVGGFWPCYGLFSIEKGCIQRTNEYPIRALPCVFDMKPIVVRNCRGCFFSKRDWNFIANCRRFTRLYLPSSAASSTPVLLASGFISVAACCCLLHASDAVQSIVPNYSGFVCC